MISKFSVFMVLFMSVFLFLGTDILGAENNLLVLAREGISDYTIVLSGEASPSEKHAAKELQMFMKMISGVSLPVCRDNENISTPMIFIGNGPRLRQIDESIDYDDLGNEGFVIRTKGPHLILAGGRLRGTMYAVYAFLEEVLGCRWYTHECSRIPRMGTIAVNQLDIKQKPAFVQRLLNARDATTDDDWAARNRLNAGARLGVTRGGRVNYQGGHTTYRLVSPYEHFDDHPEYYALYNGRREWEYRQLCASHPEVAKVAARSLIEWIEESPDDVAYNIGQEDWINYCTCPACEEINEREESTAGTNIVLVNRAADIVKKVHPDKLVGTFAYQYTLVPPKNIRLRDNVAIRLAIIRGCDAHPLELCPMNDENEESVKSWAKVCKNVFIWDYTNDFRHLLIPFPNWWSNHEDLKLFKREGISGMFLQGCSFTESGALEELQVYVQSKLLWNPDRDVWGIVDDFLNGYYGPAAPAMRNYIDTMQNIVRNLDNHFDLFSEPTVAYCEPEVIRLLEDCLDEAARAAKNNPEVLHRIEASRLSTRYIKLTQTIPHVMEGGMLKPDIKQIAYDDIDMRELDDFMDTARHHEIIALNEYGLNFARYNHMRINMGIHQVLTLENAGLKVDFLPSVGGRVIGMYDKKRGKNILVPAEFDGSRSLVGGGLSFGYSGSEISYPEIIEESNGKRLILRGFLPNSRAYNSFRQALDVFLPDDRNAVKCTATLEALQPIGRPRAMSARGSFLLGDTGKLKIGLAREDGSYESVPVPAEADRRGRISINFRRREIQYGSICLVNSEENCGIKIVFDPSQVETVSVSLDKETGSAGISLQGRQITFMARDKHTFDCEYSFFDNVSNLFD